MARCNYCGTTILFGGVRDGDRRFCNAECHQRGFLLKVADRIPDDLVAEHLGAVHDGDCPRCGGPGPVDVRTSYWVWSALVVTSWRNKPRVCCRGCGIKANLFGAASSAAIGWWGFPWGLIMTPIQVLRNLGGVVSSADPGVPSHALENMVRLNLAAHLVSQESAGADA